MSPWPFLGLLLLPLLVTGGYWLGDWWNFITPVICFIIHPLINILLKEKELYHGHDNQYSPLVYRLIALLYVPVLVLLTGWAVYKSTAMALIPFTGLAISVGIINGVIGFTLAHEFIHRHNNIEKNAGYTLLLINCYMHYGIEHVWGHHVYACTPEDPHTAKKGESLYRFLPRAISGTFLNALGIEAKILRKRKKQSHWWNNRVVQFSILQLVLVIAILFFIGWKACLFFLLQCIVAILLLHIVNYLQHYGLMRKTTDNNHFEKMAGHHSWSSGNHFGALNFFHLENHADHHINPDHTYEALQPLQDSPQHPTGYSGMIILALIPPLWFRLINQKIDAGPIL